MRVVYVEDQNMLGAPGQGGFSLKCANPESFWVVTLFDFFICKNEDYYEVSIKIKDGKDEKSCK